jgi:hypothetical protein
MNEENYDLNGLNKREILFIRKSVNKLKALLVLHRDEIDHEELLFIEKLIEKIDRVCYG